MTQPVAPALQQRPIQTDAKGRLLDTCKLHLSVEQPLLANSLNGNKAVFKYLRTRKSIPLSSQKGKTTW